MDRALSCEPQYFRGSSGAPKLRFQTLPEVDRNAPWLVSCSALSGGAQLLLAVRAVAHVEGKEPSRKAMAHATAQTRIDGFAVQAGVFHQGRIIPTR